MALSFLFPQECFWPKYSSMLNVESQSPKMPLQLTTSSRLVLCAVKQWLLKAIQELILEIFSIHGLEQSLFS